MRRGLRRLPAWAGLAALLAGLFLFSCTTDADGEKRRIDWDLSDSLKRYSNLVITLVDTADTSKVLAVVHTGKLEDPAALPTFTLPDSIGSAFQIRIRGFDDQGLLAFESKTAVADGKAGPPEKTPEGKLPSHIVKQGSRLSGLDFSEGTLVPAFTPDVFDYVLSVPYEVAALVLNATTADSEATLDLSGMSLESGEASDSVKLLVGNNPYTVTVKARGGTPSQAYAVTIKRAAGNVARLASLTVSAGELSPHFSPDSLTYEATVPAEVETLAVAAAAEDPLAQVEIGGEALDTARGRIVTLKRGASATLQIAVLSQDSSSRVTYTLKLIRARSSDAALSSLFVTGVDLAPDFRPDHLTYGAQIAQAQFAVLPVSRDTSATIKVDGAAVRSGALSGLLNSAAAGQAKVVQVEVTAGDKKTVRTYSLSLIRVTADNTLIGLSLATGAGAAIALDSPFIATRLAYKATVARTVQNIKLTLARTSTGPFAPKVTLGDSVLAGTETPGAIVRTHSFEGVLALGWNLLKIEIPGGAAYMVRIFREQSKLADLASLTVSAGVLKPAFSSAVAAYTDTVPNAAASISVTASPKDTNAVRLVVRLKRWAPLIVKKRAAGDTIPVLSLPYRVLAIDTLVPGRASKALDLAVGHNLIEVEVTAEDTSVKKVYSISVERRASSNAFLSNLIVAGSAGAVLTLDPAFTGRTLTYRISTTTGFVTVKPFEGEAGQAITVMGKSVASGAASGSLTLASGTQDFPVSVVAPDKSTTVTYTLRITKTLIIKPPIGIIP